MRFLIKHLVVFIVFTPIAYVSAQYTDTTDVQLSKSNKASAVYKWQSTTNKSTVSARSFIVPALLMGYGVASLKVIGLENFNKEIKEEVWEETPHRKLTIDNYLQYSPAVAVYGLNALGIKGKNNFRDRSMLYVLSNVFVSSTVLGVKKLSHELRPDGADYFSFPSGHTAEAFASAEFLCQEYKDISPWYGVAGYLAAGATGALRMYNNRHWISDILAGAGVGIASTKLAYWIYPAIKRKLFKDKPMNTMIMPYYQNKGGGLAMVYYFH